MIDQPATVLEAAIKTALGIVLLVFVVAGITAALFGADAPEESGEKNAGDGE